MIEKIINKVVINEGTPENTTCILGKFNVLMNNATTTYDGQPKNLILHVCQCKSLDIR